MLPQNWVKKQHITHSQLTNLIAGLDEEDSRVPEWLATGKTILNPKTKDTRGAKNFRPIACQNIIYKIYTGIYIPAPCK